MEHQVVSVSKARDPLVGRVIHDRYRVRKRIGKGGMGIVYLAEHVLIGRRVAIKILSERAFASEEMLARFQREAMAAAAVGDDHVIDVTDMGQLDDGTYYIAMEHLEGVDLATAVACDGPFPCARAVHVIAQLCDALSAVHRAGIVHRDLKPENLFLIDHPRGRDFLKVLDFGICKLAESEDPLTATGASLGTPQFMAPEQFEGSARVDARADLYAVGAILYYLLTGHEPFNGDSLPQIFMRVSSQPAPRVRDSRSDVPAALDDVVLRALQKRPEQRFADAAALKAALLSASAGAPYRRGGRAQSATAEIGDDAGSASLALPMRRAGRRLAGLAVGLLLGALAWQLGRGADSPAPAAATRPAEAPAVKRAHSAPRQDAARTPRKVSAAGAAAIAAGSVRDSAKANAPPASSAARRERVRSSDPRPRARRLPRSPAKEPSAGAAPALNAAIDPPPSTAQTGADAPPPQSNAPASDGSERRRADRYALPQRQLMSVFDNP